MRARQPDDSGYAERDGVKLRWETFGDGEPTVMLLPTWSIIHSRHWKAQVPYLARHHRVVTFDGRGCGGSDRPVGAEQYTDDQFAADTIAVLDATGTKRAVLVGLSAGALWTMLVAADAPERVLGVVTIGAAVPFASRAAERTGFPFEDPIETTEGWAKYNRHYWERDFEGFLEFFFGQMFTEPHSTKQIEDCVGWGLETEPGTLADTSRGFQSCGPKAFRDACERVRCPVLVIHGDDDAIRPHRDSEALAELTGGRLVTIEGGGHGPHARDPVAVNRLISAFVQQLHPVPTKSTWVRAARRPKRALYLCSPIGLGHARRDVAIAAELRNAPSRPRDRLARPASGHIGPRARRRTCASGVRLAGQRVGPHRGRVRRARPARVPGDPPDGRDPRQQLHGLPRRRRGAAVRPGARRRGVGRRLLPPREPRAEAVRVRVDDRLRRMDPDAERRCARGRPDDRLQRRDDRAARPVPAHPRSFDLRRRSRRHRARRASDPVCPGSASGPSRTSSSAATSRASIRSSSPTALRCATSSDTARTSACASSPSAARASEPHSCIGWRMRRGRRVDLSMVCASSSSPGRASTSRRSPAAPA